MPHLGIRLVAGSGGLDRPATWAHGCELEDPTGWLDGGEIIMTNGIAIPSDASGQRAYVDRLADRGCTAIAIGEHQVSPSLTQTMLERADERKLPVLMVAFDVPFVALARAVAQGNQNEDHDRLLDHVRIYDTISFLGADARDVDGLFSRISDLTGYHLWLVTESGRQLAGADSPMPDDLAAAIPRAVRKPPRVGNGFVVPLQLDGSVAGYLVAAPARATAEADLIAMQHVAMLATLELANVHRAWESERRRGAGMLSELLHGGGSVDSANDRFADDGWDDTRLVVSAALGDPTTLQDTHTSNRLFDREVPHLQLRLGERLWFVLGERHVDTLLAVLPRAAGVGLSGVFGRATPFVGPRREATWALERSRAGDGEPVVFSSHQQKLRWLPPDTPTLHALIAEMLGPVIDYDSNRGTSLEETLRVYLELRRSPSEAATALHCHRHTLLYRLRRIEQLTGRDFRRTSDIADFWLAIQARAALFSETDGLHAGAKHNH